MRSLDELDRWIAGKVKGWTSKVPGVQQQSKALLEVRREILEDIRGQIQPMGDGRCLFPFNDVIIHTPENEAALAALAEDGSLEQDIRDLLSEAHCAAPAVLNVAVAGGEQFQMEYGRRKAPTAARSSAKLTVVRGESETPEFVLTGDRVNIGRMKEVVGEKEGLRRRNDIAFAETETTVSREHAYIRYDPESSSFRVYDSNSQRGTAVFRDGRRIEVPRGATRGVQLKTGDEIHVGEARVRFELLPLGA
ncbi:MAG TPA: FHA domain-containing protein [Bryobacteraceae bacterium]|nr:FHA domain-containing protein [Bryobacteraceae bacterium]